MTPDPTNAELDEWEALYKPDGGGVAPLGPVKAAWRLCFLIKALRACRKLFELVVENLDSFRAPVEVGGKQLSIAGRVFALGERDEACRRGSKAKDAVVEAVQKRRECGIGIQPIGAQYRVEIYFETADDAWAFVNTLLCVERLDG